MDSKSFHERLTSCVGDRTFREIADLTGVHPESVRRYAHGGTPSVEFVAALGRALGVNLHWLLTGEGRALENDTRAHAIREVSAAGLLDELARRLEDLDIRIARVEAFVAGTGESLR